MFPNYGASSHWNGFARRPPLSNPNNLRALELQSEKKAAAAQRRLEQISRDQAAAKDELEATGLFERPQKVQQNDSHIVASVLGSYKDAQKVINSPASCIGIDYQPPTPAPFHHVIGDEEEEPKPRKLSTSGVRQGSSRLPEDISRTHRPAARILRPPPSSIPSSAMLPPSLIPSGSLKTPKLSVSTSSSTMMTNSSSGSSLEPIRSERLKNASKGLSKMVVVLPEGAVQDETRLEAMLREMKDPLCGGSNLPPPLSAIETPSIPEHEGNNSKLFPRYFVTPNLMTTTTTHKDAGALSPCSRIPPAILKPIDALSEDSDDSEHGKAEVSVSEKIISKQNSESSSSSDESSSDDSKDDSSSDEGKEETEDFSLEHFAKKLNIAKFSPNSNAGDIKKPSKVSILSEEDDDDPISGLLTTSKPILPDNLFGIGVPLSPIQQSPSLESDSIKETGSRRRRQPSHLSILDSSDEEEFNSVKKRTPRSKKKASSSSSSSSSSSCSSSRSRRNSIPIKASAPSVSLSSVTPTPSVPRILDGKTSRLNSSEREENVENCAPVSDPNVSSKKKSKAIGNIFRAKNSSSKGGKGGIRVEVVERFEGPSKSLESSSLPSNYNNTTKVQASRPSLICRIPLRILSLSTSGGFPNLYLKNDSKQRKRCTNHILSEEMAKKCKIEKPEEEEVSPVPGGTSGPSVLHPSSVNISRYLEEGGGGRGDCRSSSTSLVMPPPPKRLISYYDSNVVSSTGFTEEEENIEEDHRSYMMEAKRLKHEADREADREQQAIKYLQAVLFFSLCGNITERSEEKASAFVMYNETLSLIKHVCRPFKNSEFGTFDNKLAVLSLRCQSLLYLKLYKMRKHELKECQKIIGDHIYKASVHNSPNTMSLTPSPAGSEGSVCSKSSGYTSSGESSSRYTGVLTPPTHTPICLSVPQSVMKKQHQFCNYLSQCHELWEQADMYAHRGHCEDFIYRLDELCGSLTLHSSLKDLVKYIRTGLNVLTKEKEYKGRGVGTTSSLLSSSTMTSSSSSVKKSPS